jgi:YesN/AraC family two-component response regulator
MVLPRVLLVDDEETIRCTLARVLEVNGFIVEQAANVPQALKLLSSGSFDLLLSDLHMPGAGDGLTVVSAMRHANPKAVTMLLSAFPEMDAAARAILLQTDEILLKPVSVPVLIDAIRRRLLAGPAKMRRVESVAEILERSTELTIAHWYSLVEMAANLQSVPVDYEARIAHLPALFHDLIKRLGSSKPLGTKENHSASAVEHGSVRRAQGYSAAMLVEESRMLQVSIFQTLQNNLPHIDFSQLLIGVMTIADEVDSQLAQAMTSFTAEPTPLRQPLLDRSHAQPIHNRDLI